MSELRRQPELPSWWPIQFHRGDRVQMTKRAQRYLHARHRLIGTVVREPTLKGSVKIRFDGRKTIHKFYSGFFRRVPGEGETKP